eukprot:46768-Lingulodinium_polyedra.AAC.1
MCCPSLSGKVSVGLRLLPARVVVGRRWIHWLYLFWNVFPRSSGKLAMGVAAVACARLGWDPR